MSDVYIAVTNENGEVAYRKAEGDELAAAVKESAPYRELLSETVERRQAASALKKRLEEVTAATPPANPAPVTPPPQVPAPQAPFDIEAFRASLLQDAVKTLKEEQIAEQQRHKGVAEALREHRLPDNEGLRTILSAFPGKEKEIAGTLARAGLKVEVDDVEAIVHQAEPLSDRLLKRLGFEKE